MISFQDGHSSCITGSVKIRSPTGENDVLLLAKAVERLEFQARAALSLYYVLK
jgi:hypothetical protein